MQNRLKRDLALFVGLRVLLVLLTAGLFGFVLGYSRKKKPNITVRVDDDNNLEIEE